MFDYMRFNRAAERGKRVPKGLSELAVLKAATIVGCEFCIDIGSEYARRCGLSDEQLLALHEAHDSGLFSADELLVIDLATGMTRTPGEVDDELMARVRDALRRQGNPGAGPADRLGERRARMNLALDIGPEGFSEGKACALPDRLDRRERGGVGLAGAGARAGSGRRPSFRRLNGALDRRDQDRDHTGRHRAVWRASRVGNFSAWPS